MQSDIVRKKIMVKKISKIHARLLGLKTDPKGQVSKTNTKSFGGNEVTLPVKDDKELTTKPQEPHVVWMSLESVRHYNCEDYAIISIGDANRKPEQYPKFKTDNVLYLNFNPTFELSGWIGREHSVKLTEFYTKNKYKNFLIHCNYGGQRSPGIAFGICEALRDTDNSRNVYKWSLRRIWEKKKIFEGSYDARCASVAYSAVCRADRQNKIEE